MAGKNVIDMTLRANMDLSQVSSGLNQMQGILKQLKLSPSLKKDFDSLFASAAADLEKYQSKLENGFKTKGDITGFEKVAQGLEKSLDKIGVAWSKLQEKDLSKLVKLDSSLIERIQQFDNKFKELEKTLKGNITESLKTVVGQINSLSTKTSKQTGLGIAEALGAGEYKEAIALADEYIAKLQKMGAEARGGNYKANLDTFIAIRNEITKVVSETQTYNQEINKLQVDKLAIMAEAAEKTGEKLQQGANILSGVTQKTREYNSAVVESGKKTVELGADIDSLKNRVQYFFSLTNSVMLFRRILQDTIQTTKELDAAMAETAVVTDFSVADMWKDLPRYTATAKELGATIQGVYETMTLYYQQGLKTNEVFEVGTETLKMARIAGLDYAQATDFMTAALRGFNMEVNELNAQKVNDVYSELAAITAADTQEIATAMTKTASIASNANMEFETTAAFLSQIIETTRESAETAGTAMKTVIARFTELKKDPAEIGEVDGEIVDANKIETALRTIDVALRDTSGQFRDLDDVFLDIAEKWEGLDTNTQRYIATMAAGSRQQSRFIAMMSDYDRTMQLVSAANNSAGASQKQFDKTLESLEAKLNRLKDAWDQFTMGIANNTLIKAGVDALTGILNIINKITEYLPGPTKGIGNLLILIAGFKGGEKVFRAFSASILADFTALSKGTAKAGERVGDSFFGALKKEFSKTTQLFKSTKTLTPTIDVKEYKKKLEEVSKLSKDIWHKESAVDTSNMSMDEKIVQMNKVSEAMHNSASASKELGLITKATTEQQGLYFSLLESGIPKEAALLALEEENNEATYEAIARKTLSIATGKAENEVEEEQVETLTKKLIIENTTNATSLKGIALRKLSSIAYDSETGAVKTSTAAKIADWIITKMLNGEWLLLAGAIAAVVGVIALVVGGFKLLSHLIETNAEKQERLNKAVQQTSESMTEAKTKIDDIKSAMEELGGLETEFDGLIKGTDAWKEKLIEVNNKVLELLQTYPTLAQYVSQGVNGELTISSEGWDEILQQQQNKLNTATFANTVAKNQLEVSGRSDKIKDAAKESGLTDGAASANDINTLAHKFAREGKFLTPDTDISGVMSYLQDDLKAILEKDNGIADFNKLVGMYNSSMLQTQKSTEAMATQLVSQNEKVAGTKYEQGIAKSIASQIEVDQYGNLPTEVLSVLNEKYGTFSADGQATNLDKSEIWKQYAAYSGESYANIKEKYKDDDDGTYALALELASQDAAKALTDSADNLIKGLNRIGDETLNISKDWEDIVKNLFSDGLTEKDLETYTNYTDSNRLTFDDLPEEIQDYFGGDSYKWQEFLADQVKESQEQQKQYTDILKSIGLGEGEKTQLDTSNLSTEAILGLAKNLEEVYYKSGQEGVSAITESFNTAIKGLPREEVEKVASALNNLNWSQISSIEDLKTHLKEMGIVIDKVTLEQLTTDIIKFNKATRGVSLEELTTQLKTLDELSKNLEEREYDEREFTEEEKNELTELEGIDESMFVGYGDSWMYVGDSLSTLEEAVRENTSAIIESTIDELKKQKETADFVTDKDFSSQLSNYGVLKTEERQALLGQVLSEAQRVNLTELGGYNINSLQGLATQEEDLDAAQVNFLNELLSLLSEAIGTEDSIQTKIDSATKSAGVQQYGSVPTSEMADVAINSEDPIEMQKATEALLYKAAQYTQLNDEIKKYNDALTKNNKALQEEAKRELATGVAIAEKAKKLDKLDDKISDNIDSLEDMDKESAAYEETLEDTATMINEIFDSNIDKEFISGENAENLKLLQEGLDGSQESWNQFINNITQAKFEVSDFATQFNADAQDITAINSALDNLQFDINGTADMTQVVAAMMAAGATAEQVAEYLEKLGFTNIQFSVETEPVTLPDGNTVNVPKSFTAVNSYVPAASMASNFGGGGGSSGGGGGGGGDSVSEEEPWENSFDKFYNITEDINELLDRRNELEAEYNMILQNEKASIQDYIKSYTDRIKSFKEEIALQEEMLRLRQLEQKDILSDNSHLSEYAWIEDGKVQIDYEAIDQVEDQELGEEIEEYVSKLEENDDAIQEATDAITESTAAIEDLLDEWRDKTADFEQRVFDALVAEREKEIERFEESNEALEESNSELISAIQKEINERRQQRENDETEQDLAEKERRLAFLQQDTSGAYDQEILQLEKDLKQQKEDYTDTLIDQRIADLEEQNDEAAKQREKQIQILQYQLKNEQDTGVIANQVRQLLQEANSDAGWRRVWGLLEEADGFKGLTDTNKAVWTEDTQGEFKQAMAYLNGMNGGGIAEALANISTNVTYEYYSSDYSGEDSSDYSSDYSSSGSSSYSSEDSEDNSKSNSNNISQVSQVETDANGIKYYKINGKWYKSSDTSGLDDDEGTTTLKDGAKAVSSIMIKQDTLSVGGVVSKDLKEKSAATSYIDKNVATENINGKTYYKYNGAYYTSNPLSSVYRTNTKTYDVILPRGLSVYKKYKTGGLADYTGPAWLDGTKSRPELVLNQKDTQNFLQLKDVLSSFMKNNQTTVDNSSSVGDTIYDISISVEKMSSDYDVEQVANKIKQMISNDALYRNSNMINRLR